jgi:plastocyanin
MNRLYALLLFAFPLLAAAQVTFTIEATGGTGLGTPLYNPQFITILVGDIVQWNGVSGTHNVYGELDDFPNNPEGFSSGQPQPSP